MGTYYCVERPGVCDGTCGICPVDVERQLEIDLRDKNDKPLFANDGTYPDNVNRPAHYTMGRIEVFDFIQAWELDFPTGNVVKYVVRAPYKKNKLEDLKKARWYLDQLIKQAENE